MRTEAGRKAVVGVEMLVPVFLLMFALIVIFAGIEWSMNTLSLMAEEKQITQMDAEILGLNQLYIEPSLRFTMQDVTRDLALHGGLSSDILANRKLFVLEGTSNEDIEDIRQKLEKDFADGNLDFPSVESQMKVEGNILYWSDVKGENQIVETIPYKYNELPYSSTTIGCDSCPGSIVFKNSSTLLIKNLKGSLNKYVRGDGGAWVLPEAYTGPTVISSGVEIMLEAVDDSEADLEGAYDITSAFKPIFPDVSYPGDALSQRIAFPRFTDIMMSDRLNTYRSDYGSSKTSVGSTLSLGTWNAYFIPQDSDSTTTLSFYGGNRIASNTGFVSMENTDPVMVRLDNSYWKLFGIAEEFFDDVKDDDFLSSSIDSPKTIDAFYRKKYESFDIFRENRAKTCTGEWQDVHSNNTYTCSGQQDDNIYDDVDTCYASSHTDSGLYIKEITIDSHEYDAGEPINVYVDIICVPDEEFVWTVAYSWTESDWEFIESGTSVCPGITMISNGGSTRLTESFTMECVANCPTQHIRASVGKAGKGDSAGEICMGSSHADNDEITFEHLASVVSTSLYADYVNDSCFDGDTECRFSKTCNEKYSDAPPVLRPKNAGDKFATLKADSLYTSKPIRFDVADDFNYDYRQKFIDKNIVPFLYDKISDDDLADNISAPNTEMYLTFNYGSNTTLGCGEREDIIEEIKVYLDDYYGKATLLATINPDLEATDNEDFFREQKIRFSTSARDRIAKNIADNGYIDLKLQVKTSEYGENMPSQMYTDRNQRVYIFDNLLSGAYPSRIIDINPEVEKNDIDPTIENGFAEAKGIAVDRDGNIYVINHDDSRLHKYNKYGMFKGYMDLPDLDPRGIDIDTATGNIYISYYDGKNITRYDNFFDSRDFALNPGIPPRAFEMCTAFGSAHPTDVTYYKGTLFAVFDNNKLDFCHPQSNSWFIGSLPDVSAGDKIMAISADSAADKLYAKVIKPVFDPVTSTTTNYRYYYVYNLSAYLSAANPTTTYITRLDSETIPIDFSFEKFDIYTPKEGGDAQAYFVRDTSSKPDTYALLDDFTLNIDFGNNLRVDVDSIENVEGLTDKIKYYEDGCGSVAVKDDCEVLWIQYALNEYYDKFDLYNAANCGAGATEDDAARIKSLLGLQQSDSIPCTQTIDSANIDSFLGAFMRVKVEDKIIGPRIEDLVRQYNDDYNGDEIYIDVDYKINSDFSTSWDSDEYWAEKDSYSTGSINTGVPCACKGKSQSCLGGYSGDGVSSRTHRTNSWCEYKYGAIYSFNITIEDRSTDVWDPVLHKMTTLKFKYGFEWSVLDKEIDNIYTADERDLAPYRGGHSDFDDSYSGTYCGYSPDFCHVQNGIPNYEHYLGDSLDCPSNAGDPVTYNVLHCQNDDYSICYGPRHSHSCGEGCSYTHRHKSCTRYEDCPSKASNAKYIDFNYYKSACPVSNYVEVSTPPAVTPPATPDPDDDCCCDEDGNPIALEGDGSCSGVDCCCDDDEDCIDGESEFLLDDITINSHEASVSDPVSITYDMSYLNTLCIKTTFNPATPTPIIPNGCNCAPMENLPQYPNILTEDSGSIKDLTIYINKSYVGTLSIEKKDSCP